MEPISERTTSYSLIHMKNTTSEYDVIVIGGGATGAGTARDCAMRGLK